MLSLILNEVSCSVIGSMLRSLVSFALIVCFFWFFPDLYLWSRNSSNALFQEAANLSTLRVEIKVTKAIPFLPLRYGVLGKAEKDYYVELYSPAQRRAFGYPTQDGTALLPNIMPDTYEVRVAKMREFGDIDVRRYTDYGEPLLLEEELLKTSLSILTVSRDVFAVAVLVEE